MKKYNPLTREWEKEESFEDSLTENDKYFLKIGPHLPLPRHARDWLEEKGINYAWHRYNSLVKSEDAFYKNQERERKKQEEEDFKYQQQIQREEERERQMDRIIEINKNRFNFLGKDNSDEDDD